MPVCHRITLTLLEKKQLSQAHPCISNFVGAVMFLFSVCRFGKRTLKWGCSSTGLWCSRTSILSCFPLTPFWLYLVTMVSIPHFRYALGWVGTKAVVCPMFLPLRSPHHLHRIRVRGCVPVRYGRTLLHLAAHLILIIMLKAFALCYRAIVCCSVLPVLVFAAVTVWR